MASSEATWTVDDAVEAIDETGIPITRRQLVTLIAILDICPVGKRQGPRGNASGFEGKRVRAGPVSDCVV
jgi:hypothetical protein